MVPSSLLAELVERVLVSFGREAAEPHAFGGTLGSRIVLWAERAQEWNQRIDLTAARSAEELIDLLVADAAALARASSAARNETWIDVGSGVGAPGLALALLMPDLRFNLVEPKDKRVAFLRSVVGHLALTSVVVTRARSQALPPRCVDVAVSRATLPPAEWLAEGARLARRRVWVLLAQGTPPEAAGWELESDVSYDWPLTGARRRAVSYVLRAGS
ncbi:MAG TPA: RsmG family class I SAM-dependent methyltransferase [Polyangiaceae bacterium]|nr:RsmG family class I SAM-dependent methyltransferase [Polyangiaceae bacterium]